MYSYVRVSARARVLFIFVCLCIILVHDDNNVLFFVDSFNYSVNERVNKETLNKHRLLGIRQVTTTST